MRVERHLLEQAGADIAVDRRLRADATTRSIITPRLIVIHYAVTHTYDETARLGEVMPGVAWHLTVGERRVAQHLPCNRRGAHAGESRWGELTQLNGHSIGIELPNPGPLLRGTDGQYRDTTAQERVWRGEVHVEEGGRYRYWAAYSDELVDTVEAVCATLRDVYPLVTDIVGHSDVSPGRKIDPGPAYPLVALREAVFGGAK